MQTKVGRAVECVMPLPPFGAEYGARDELPGGDVLARGLADDGCDVRVKLSAGLSRSTTFFVVRSSAWIFVPSGMSLAATTIATSSQASDPAVPPSPPPLSVRTTRTNATMARKIPMSRTNRFERFK